MGGFHGSTDQGRAFLRAIQELGGSATTAQLRPRMKRLYGSEDVRNGAASLRKVARQEWDIQDAVACEYAGSYTDGRGRARRIYRYTLCEELRESKAQATLF